ncbi:MAG: protease [Pedobacter sp.]|nr:MAG: protease [Pedobacter sp.]
MKNRFLILAAGVILFAACGTARKDKNSDALVTATKPGQLWAKMQIMPEVKPGNSIEMRFTVYNSSDKSQQFCKWHTPFEPPMSKYLDITDEEGVEAQYMGAMAKRIMPPPADSYITVKPGDSLSVKVDLSKIYRVEKAGRYVVRYVAQEMSGLSVKDSVTFALRPK